MSYTIEKVNNCTKKLVFNFDQVDLTNEIKQALLEKQASSNLKGFRKGKAPLSMIQQFYGPQVENDALFKFISNQYFEAVQKENIKPVSYPQFANTKYEAGKTVAFEATVEVFPEFDINDYSHFSFTKGSDVVTDEDLEALKMNYLSSKAEVVEVEDESHELAKGDFAVFHFEGELEDGAKPENMKAKDYMLEIGSGQFIPGFEDGMIGLKKGEKKDVKVTFPSEYHEKSLQNVPVTFHVELLEIKVKKLPDFNDDLAKELGYESVDDFMTKNKTKLTEQKKREVQTNLHQEILEKLVEENPFDVPEALLNNQKESVKEDLVQTLKQQGLNEQMMSMYFEKWDEDLNQKAMFQVKSGLILDKLSKKFNIETSEEDFNEKIKEIAEQSGMSTDDVLKYYNSQEKIKNNIMYAIREEKTFAALIKEMKVS